MRAGDGARADESLRKFAILLLCFSSLAFSTSREGNIISFSFVSNHERKPMFACRSGGRVMRSLLAGHRPATSSLSKLGAAALGSLRPTAKLLSTARPLSTTKPLSTTRPLSTALATDHSDDKWESDFLAATATIRSDVAHEESAACLRELVRSGLLRHTDLRDHPERFFKAHRLLARHAVEHGPGFWIRFTVHYKCAATAAQTPR